VAVSRKRTAGSLVTAAVGPSLVVLGSVVLGLFRPWLVVVCLVAVAPLFLWIRGSGRAQRAIIAVYDLGLVSTRRMRGALARYRWRPRHPTTTQTLESAELRIRAQIERTNVGVLSNADMLRSLSARLVEQAEHSKLLEQATIRLEATVERTAREAATRVIRDHRSALQWTFQQVEALDQLHRLFDLRAPIPASRGWAASPDLLLWLVEFVRREQPRVVVECGSGLSTMWIALALREAGHGRVIALEHDETHAAHTRSLLEEHGVAEHAEVRHGWLEKVELPSGTSQPWYHPSSFSDIESIDLLFVDGPPADTAPLARLPAIPLLAERLSPRSVIVLDDLVRSEERTVLAEWLNLLPEASVEELAFEKGCAVIRA
jgi:predicted O-methyltransferase YrrM